MDIIFEQRFDAKRMLQYVNDEPSVLHCHHYAVLFSKLAIEQADIDGPKLLRDAMEETFFLVFKKYYIKNNITSRHDKIRIAEEYSRLTGLGLLKLEVNQDGGYAQMRHSHVDEGWIKKWSKTDYSVNYISQGFIIAAFDIINNTDIRTYEIKEVQSIVKGDPISKFEIKLR